jgi:hypothetical protein
MERIVVLAINGVPAGTYTDIGNLYAPSAAALYFLLDNTTGSAAITETDPGVIAYLQVRDTPLTQDEVAASLSGICTVVACGDATVGPTFESIRCRLDTLLARVNAEPGLGTFQPKLSRGAQKGIDEALRTELLEAAEEIAPDVKTLRADVQC